MRTLLAVFHSQHGFAIFGGHANQPGHPHPEHGTRPAQGDGSGYADNVADAHRGCQCGHQGGEVADVATLACILVENHAQGQWQCAELQTLEQEGEVDAGADQQGEHGRTPYPAGKC